MKNQWSDKDAAIAIRSLRRAGVQKHLAECVYASRLLGERRDLVLHGGGNTSVKTQFKDNQGHKVGALHVKASGHDLNDIGFAGFVALDLEQLRCLEKLKTLDDRAMLASLARSKLDPFQPTPSVETLLHAFLPAKYIFHTHANAVLALTNQPDDKTFTEIVCGNGVIVLPYAMSGFALAKKALEAIQCLPDAQALVVMKHGIFTFGDTAKEAYGRMLNLVSLAEKRLRQGRKNVFSTLGARSGANLIEIAPALRGALSRYMRGGVILDFRTNKFIRAFVDGSELSRYSQAGPVTPDHVIWTKSKPMILETKANISRVVDDYAAAYNRSFNKLNAGRGLETNKRDPSPRVVLVPGMGLFGIGETARISGISADLAETSIDVITSAERVGRFTPASPSDIFKIEYWQPELDKLNVSAPAPLEGSVVLVTGGGSGIGAATARAFNAAGAEVVVVDLNERAAEKVASEIGGLAVRANVTDGQSIRRAFDAVVKTYGGVDVVVSNAGAAWQGEIGTVSENVLRKSFELNFFAHQKVAQNAIRIMRAQNSTGGAGGCLLFNISKQAVNPGKNFGPYGLPKAATFFLIRQYALDHGKDRIRVNGVNGDRIRSGLLTHEMISKRSFARGMSEGDYMAGNLLGREVVAEDVAKAFIDLALSQSTTGAVLTVDGGNIEAALR